MIFFVVPRKMDCAKFYGMRNVKIKVRDIPAESEDSELSEDEIVEPGTSNQQIPSYNLNYDRDDDEEQTPEEEEVPHHLTVSQQLKRLKRYN